MAVKYQISFKDMRDNDCSADLDFSDYRGNPVVLEGSDTPVTITYDGDQDDLFQPIITSKATLNVFINKDTQQFVSDVRDIDDKQVTVTIKYGKGKKWIGNLISDQNYEKFDRTGYFMSLTCVDPFSYLKSDDKKILSTTSMYGIQTLYDFIVAILSESGHDIPVVLINNYKPDYSGALDILHSSYCYTETFMSDGVFPSGYDIIEKIMTSLCMTCFFDNGTLYAVNRRSQINYTAKIINNYLYSKENYLINNSESITRTRAAKQLSAKYDYGNRGSVINNGYFYFYNPDITGVSGITGWSISDDVFTGCSIVREGTGDSDNPFCVNISGIYSGTPATGVVWFNASSSLIDTQNTSYYRLTVKYKCPVYKNTGSSTSDVYPLMYGINIFTIDDNGDRWYYQYKGDSNLNPKNDGSEGHWSKLGSGINTNAGIQFPIANKGSEGTFDLTLLGDIFYNIGTPPHTFYIELRPILTIINQDYLSKVGISNMPTSIKIESVEFFSDIRTISEESAPEGYYGDLYQSDTTQITNSKNLSLIDDAIDISLGAKYVFRIFPSSDAPFTLSNGSLFTNDRQFVENITNGTITDKIVTVVAKDRMFFGRNSRYKIDCEIRSDDINFSDILKFTEGDDILLPNVYSIMSNEIDVRKCTNHIVAQELVGSDDNTDTINNYLSA